MKKNTMLLLAVGSMTLVTGWLFANQNGVQEQGFLCPKTGEVLACPSCCPEINGK